MTNKAREVGSSGKWIYEIRVEGQLGSEWSSWFDGLTVAHERNETTGDVVTVISGTLPDQSALHGLLNKIRDLNLTILSFNRKP